MKALLTAVVFASGAAASNRWWPSEATSSDPHRCKEVAGIYQFTEVINEFAVGAATPVFPGTYEEDQTCVGAVGLLQVFPNCDWFLKRLRNDPIDGNDPQSMVEDDHSCMSDNTGKDAEQLIRHESEFWSFPVLIGRSFSTITFSVAPVPNFVHGAMHIVGAIEKENGCSATFEGWRVDRDEHVVHCKKGYINDVYRAGKAVKRRAQLTDSSTSSVSVSDIKDALALIAQHIPDFTESGSTTTTTSESDAELPCRDIDGVYQVQLINNEYDDSEVGAAAGTVDYATQKCSNMVGFVEILENCEYQYKFIRPALNNTLDPSYLAGPDREMLCIDDSGAETFPIGPLETEFWCFLQDTTDNIVNDGRPVPAAPRPVDFSKFKFAVNRVYGSQNPQGPLFLSGIYEYHAARAWNGHLGEGCDYAVTGWKTKRAQLFPCRDTARNPLNIP